MAARTLSFMLSAALCLAGDATPARAAAKTGIEIVPGAKSISSEEKAMTADPAHGSQHGVILVDEAVRDESSGTETNLIRHVRAKIFSNEGRRLGDIEIEHDRERGLLKKWWGFTLLPDGTVLETNRNDLKEQELASSRGRAYVALKTSLPGIVPGCVIDYGYVLQEPGFYSTTRVDIQEESPVKLFRFRWVPFTGWTASFGLSHTEGLAVTQTRDQRSVLVTGTDLPAALDEPYMPPEAESRASALFYYRASGSKPKDFWDLEAQRLLRRATTFAREKPIQQAVSSIKVPAGADLMTKLKAAYDWASVNLRNTSLRTAEEAEAVRADDKEKPEDWKTAQDVLTTGAGKARDLDFFFFRVRDRVRYVAIELGIGGYQPRPASETFSRLYGDCKDKGTLLQAVLAARGITAYPLLVNAGGRMAIPDSSPVLVFNHLILAAAIPDEVALPARYDSAVMKDSDFGRLLVLDSTDEFTPAGSLSAILAGQRAVLVAGARGRLVTLPTAEASSHRLERHLDLSVRPGRIVSARAETRLFGEFAKEARGDFHQSSVDRRRDVEGRWTRLWPGASVEGYVVEPETNDGAFVEKCEIKMNAPAAAGTDIGVPLFPGASWDLDRVPLGKRKNPVDYVFPRTLLYQVSLEGLPPGAVLSEPQRLEGNGWEAETRIRREDTRVEAEFEIRLSRVRFDPADFPELRRFWNAISMLESGMVQLSP